MKIGIDIRILSFHHNKAGIYQYVYNLVSNLLSVDAQNEYILLSTIRGFRGDEKISSHFVRRFSGRLSTLFLEKLSVPVEVLIGKINIFHGPCFFIPRSLSSKSIVTIHDLLPFRHPEFLPVKWNNAVKKSTYASVKKADSIIAVSDYTKNEIMDLFKIPGERIRVIHNGISPIFKQVKDQSKINDVKAKYGVNGPYLLFVGNIEPKKNIEKLIRAFVMLRNETDYKYSLLIAGGKAWHYPKVRDLVRELQISNEIIFTDVVEDDELPHLYSGAELFVFPSLHEGFGIPVIEAMSCGTPVVTSNATSIPEIAGDAALLIDPSSESEIAEAMHKILSSSIIRGQLIKKGIERAKKFSWEKTSLETLKLYKENYD